MVVFFPCNATAICLAKTIIFPAKENCGLNWNCKRRLVNPQVIDTVEPPCFKGTIIVHRVPVYLGSFNPWITGP